MRETEILIDCGMCGLERWISANTMPWPSLGLTGPVLLMDGQRGSHIVSPYQLLLSHDSADRSTDREIQRSVAPPNQ